MCGIAGFTNPGPDARNILGRMNATLAHRGPDGNGTFVDRGVALGHTRLAIIDITGVPIVDTLVAQHLLKTVAAARLMGADCLISGIRPQIAATIVHLGVELRSVVTKATLADAFAVALKRIGQTIQRVRHTSAQEAGRGSDSDS